MYLFFHGILFRIDLKIFYLHYIEMVNGYGCKKRRQCCLAGQVSGQKRAIVSKGKNPID